MHLNPRCALRSTKLATPTLVRWVMPTLLTREHEGDTKGFVSQAMAIDSSSLALLCLAQVVMLYWYLFCASINLTLLTVPTHIDGCTSFPVYRPGRKYALISKYVLKSPMRLSKMHDLICAYVNENITLHC